MNCWTPYRREMLAHCTWLIDAAGIEYALHAAKGYEERSHGVLEGLYKRIQQEVERKRIEKAKEKV